MQISKKKISCCLKIVLIILLHTSFLVLLTGCWDSRELSELAVIGAIGVAKENDKIHLTYEVIKPIPSKKSETSENPIKYLEANGDSLMDAESNINLMFDADPFMPHANCFIFDEGISREGLMQYIDFFIRDQNFRWYVHCAVTKGEKPSEFIGLDGGIEKIPSRHLEAVFDNNENNPKSVSIKLFKFIKDYYEDGKEPVMGVVEKIKRIVIEKSGEKKEEYDVVVEGAAVFLQDEFIGFLMELRQEHLI